MVKIVGIEQKEGSFTDDKGRSVEYDNVILYCVTDSNPDCLGMSVLTVKVPRRNFVSITGYSEVNRDMIGQCISLEYVPRLTGSPLLSHIAFLGTPKA